MCAETAEPTTVAPGADMGTQPVTVTAPAGAAGTGQGERTFPASMIPKRYGGDYSRAFHDANQYDELERSGFGALVQRMNAHNEANPDDRLDGYKLAGGFELLVAAALQKPPGERTGPEKQAVAEARKEVKADAAAEGETLTKAEVEALLEAKWNEREQRSRSTEETRQAAQTESKAMDDALEAMGVKNEPTDYGLYGRTTKMDPVFAYVFRPFLASLIQTRMNAEYDPRDPQYDAKRQRPAPPHIIAEAKDEAAKIMALLSARVGGKAEDAAAKLPPASMKGGGGGATAKNPEDMTPDEAKIAAVAYLRRMRGAK